MNDLAPTKKIRNFSPPFTQNHFYFLQKKTFKNNYILNELFYKNSEF